MATARYRHAAAALPDGRVLIAGGYDDADSPLASAELFDPVTQTFSDAGSMVEARADFAMAYSGNGQILIPGGSDNATAEIYGSDTYLTVGSPSCQPPTERGLRRATKLDDGRVLITGGHELGWTSVNEIVVNEAFVFTPGSDTVAATGSMNVARANHGSVKLPDGRVLVFGGRTDVATGLSCSTGNRCLDSAEIYDPTTGTFSLEDPMPVGRDGVAGIELDDGRILIVGTPSDRLTTNTPATIYDPTAPSGSRWVAPATQPTYPQAAHLTFLMHRLDDGRILVLAGSQLQFFDQGTETFSAGPTPPLNTNHSGTEVVAPLEDGRVFFGPRSRGSEDYAYVYLTSGGMSSLLGWPRSRTVSILSGVRVVVAYVWLMDGS